MLLARAVWLLKFDVQFSTQMSTRCPIGHISEISKYFGEIPMGAQGFGLAERLVDQPGVLLGAFRSR